MSINRDAVGAHYGLRDWLMQRVTAVVMVGFTLVLLAILLLHPPADTAAWRAIFAPQWFKLLTFLFLLALALHAWVGVRDVLMDYIHSTGLRLTLLCGVIIALVAYAAWGVHILWGLA